MRETIPRAAVLIPLALVATVAALLLLWMLRSVSLRVISLLTSSDAIESPWTAQLVDRFVWVGLGILAVCVVVLLPWSVTSAPEGRIAGRAAARSGGARFA